MLSKLSFVLLASTHFLLGAVSAEKIECPAKNDYKLLDDNLVKITGYINDPQYSYPENDKSAEKYCKNIKEGELFAKSYATQCLSGSSKTILSVFAYSINRSNRKFCGRNSASKGRREMISFAPCANKQKKETKKCYDTYLSQLHFATTIQDSKKRLAHVCCTTTFLRSCITSSLEGECPAAAIDAIGNYLDQNFGNLLNTFCDGNDDSSDKCSKLRVGKPKLGKNTYQTPFPTVFQIFETL